MILSMRDLYSSIFSLILLCSRMPNTSFLYYFFFRSNRHTFELNERKTKDRDKNLCFIYSFFIAIRLDFNSLIQEGIRIEKGFKLILGCQPDHCFQLLSVWASSYFIWPKHKTYGIMKHVVPMYGQNLSPNVVVQRNHRSIYEHHVWFTKHFQHLIFLNLTIQLRSFWCKIMDIALQWHHSINQDH